MNTNNYNDLSLPTIFNPISLTASFFSAYTMENETPRYVLSSTLFMQNRVFVGKYGVQILGTTDSQVVQQSYTSPRTHNQK